MPTLNNHPMSMSMRRNTKWKVTALAVLLGATALYFYTLNTKKMENTPQKEGTLDKIIFGLLLGGAIGSVLGLTVAPQKGSELRKKLKVQEMMASHDDVVAVVSEKSKGIFGIVSSFFRKKTRKAEPDILSWMKDFQEIPSEK